MLARTDLEKLLTAWPDEKGYSTDPDTYYSWVKKERSLFRRIVFFVIGRDRLDALSGRQYDLLEKSLDKLLEEKSILEISSDEIFAKYEIITEHISPLWLEKKESEECKKPTKIN